MRMRYPVTKACDMKRWIALLNSIAKAGYEPALQQKMYQLAKQLNPDCYKKCGTDIKKCENGEKPIKPCPPKTLAYLQQKVAFCE